MKEVADWAEATFGHANLNDKRRTRRLVKMATDIANQAGESLVKACGDDASIEGAYRFVRNPNIHAVDIARAGFDATADLIASRHIVLAIEDTTGLQYNHSISKELGEVSSVNKNKKPTNKRSLFVHSTLMVDAQSEETLGLSHQASWIRTTKKTGSKRQRQKQALTEKESYKWLKASEQVTANNIIHVCDREADMFEYFAYQSEHQGRFIVRAAHNRRLNSHEEKLMDLAKSLKGKSSHTVNIIQKGGRKARSTQVEIAYSKVELKVPGLLNGKPITLNLVICREVQTDDNVTLLNWLLLTSEPVENMNQARQIVRYYELRWRIEDFHKVWKSGGTQVESLRMQSKDNLERMSVILAFVAIRLMQLKELCENTSEEQVCTSHFNNTEWKLLWKKVEKAKLPKEPPNLKWAYYAMAKLGGWNNSKRTGKVSVRAIWDGWITLNKMLEGIRLMQELSLE